MGMFALILSLKMKQHLLDRRYYEHGIFRMWYSFKDPAIGYGMGYTGSNDGIKWSRMDDKVGIDVSKEVGIKMIQYPYVLITKIKSICFIMEMGMAKMVPV